MYRVMAQDEGRRNAHVAATREGSRTWPSVSSTAFDDQGSLRLEDHQLHGGDSALNPRRTHERTKPKNRRGNK